MYLSRLERASAAGRDPGGSAIARGESGSDSPVEEPEPKNAIACGSPASAASQVVIARVSGNQGYDCTRHRVNWTGVISCAATHECVSHSQHGLGFRARNIRV